MKKIIAILLSAVFLLSQLIFTIGSHYCGGEFIESKIITGNTQLGCGMENLGSCDNNNSSNDNDLSISSPPCCENQYETIQLSDDILSDIVRINSDIDFTAVFINPSKIQVLLSKSAKLFYADYSPPPLEKDIQMLFRSFLI